MASNQQGTGKHPHESSEEPYPHHGGSSEKRQASSGQQSSSSSSSSGGSGSGSSNADLKQREYRDDQGNVHHHTRTYEEQHGKK